MMKRREEDESELEFETNPHYKSKKPRNSSNRKKNEISRLNRKDIRQQIELLNTLINEVDSFLNNNNDGSGGAVEEDPAGVESGGGESGCGEGCCSFQETSSSSEHPSPHNNNNNNNNNHNHNPNPTPLPVEKTQLQVLDCTYNLITQLLTKRNQLKCEKENLQKNIQYSEKNIINHGPSLPSQSSTIVTAAAGAAMSKEDELEVGNYKSSSSILPPLSWICSLNNNKSFFCNSSENKRNKEY